mgnify:CR=1 FL=1
MSDNTDRPYLDDVPQDVQDLIYQGQKIRAIKLVREKMGLGLKEAKERVDEVATRLCEQFPEDFTAGENSGCGTALLSVAALFAVGLYLVVTTFWR